MCAVIALSSCRGHGADNNSDSGSMEQPDTGAGVKPITQAGLGGKNDTMKKTPKEDTIPGGNGSGSGGSVTPKSKP